jgi:hypothetical protein
MVFFIAIQLLVQYVNTSQIGGAGANFYEFLAVCNHSQGFFSCYELIVSQLVFTFPFSVLFLLLQITVWTDLPGWSETLSELYHIAMGGRVAEISETSSSFGGSLKERRQSMITRSDQRLIQALPTRYLSIYGLVTGFDTFAYGFWVPAVVFGATNPDGIGIEWNIGKAITLRKSLGLYDNYGKAMRSWESRQIPHLILASINL